jgi:hypothetical protein
MDAKRLPRLLVLAAALGIALYGARQWAGHVPRDQTVHYVLGDGAQRVEEVDARWAAAETRASRGSFDRDWMREASFRYAPGAAPRVVTHEPRMPDGDYDVEIEIVAAHAARNVVARETPDEIRGEIPDDRSSVVVRRHVTLNAGLSGGVTSIELGDSVPR